MQAHGNVNVNSTDIVKLEKGVSRISINKQTKIYKKNAELMLDKHGDFADEYDVLMVAQETSKKHLSPDDNTYLFNSSGISPMSKGMSVILTFTDEVRHYSFGYLDRIVTAIRKNHTYDNERILQDIMMFYKREEDFIWSDYESLSLTPTTLQYIETCEKIGKINSAVKRFIKEGRI
jgi:hypothetical protein